MINNLCGFYINYKKRADTLPLQETAIAAIHISEQRRTIYLIKKLLIYNSIIFL
jgi:hypothetical protein